MDIKSSLLSYLLPLFLTLAVGITCAALAALTRWLLEKGKETKLYALASRVSILGEAVVRDVDATVRPLIVEAAKDGTITAEELKELKYQAMKKMRESLGTKGLVQVHAAFGDVSTFLSGVLEKSVSNVRLQEAVKAAPAVAKVLPSP